MTSPITISGATGDNAVFANRTFTYNTSTNTLQDTTGKNIIEPYTSPTGNKQIHIKPVSSKGKYEAFAYIGDLPEASYSVIQNSPTPNPWNVNVNGKWETQTLTITTGYAATLPSSNESKSPSVQAPMPSSATTTMRTPSATAEADSSNVTVTPAPSPSLPYSSTQVVSVTENQVNKVAQSRKKVAKPQPAKVSPRILKAVSTSLANIFTESTTSPAYDALLRIIKNHEATTS